MNRIDALRLGVMFLTRLPVGRMDGTVFLSRAAWTFPVVGLIPGAAAWAAFELAGGDALGALLAVGLAALVTGALHWDGLADFADGMGGGRDRDHVLDIMRDSRIGSYGVLVMILCVGLQVVAIVESASGWAFLATAVLSRFAMLDLLVRTPAARGDGLGSSAAGGATYWPGVALSAILILLLGAAGIFAALAGWLALSAVRRVALRRIGGQTGDVCGAAQVLTETTLWVCLAIAA